MELWQRHTYQKTRTAQEISLHRCSVNPQRGQTIYQRVLWTNSVKMSRYLYLSISIMYILLSTCIKLLIKMCHKPKPIKQIWTFEQKHRSKSLHSGSRKWCCNYKHQETTDWIKNDKENCIKNYSSKNTKRQSKKWEEIYTNLLSH